MRSIIFLLPCALAEFQDESTLMQINRVKIRAAKTGDAHALLQKMQNMANSFAEGSDTMMSDDAVDDALAAAQDALNGLSPAIMAQVQTAQSEVNDAAAAVQACHNEDQAQLRASALATSQEMAADATACVNTLEALSGAEATQCAIAEDCLCDEARVRTQDQETLCASKTETHEVAYCEFFDECTIFASCHYAQSDVYAAVRADVEAEMALTTQEYIATEQSNCLMALIMQAMLTRSPINAVAMAGCAAVNTDAMNINYPALPAPPAVCPAAQFGNPQCGTWQLIVRHNVAGGYFNSGVRNTFLSNEDDPDSDTFMSVGQLTPADFLINDKYYFKLIYTGLRDAAGSCNDGPSLNGQRQEYQWTQTSWITETTVANFEPVSVDSVDLAASPNAGCVFSGVARSSSGSTTFDGSPTHGNWFHSIGSVNACNAGIPAFKGGAAQGMSLYVRKAATYSHVHDGHCAGGWLGGNTYQSGVAACSQHCRSQADCRYFAFCEGPTGCDGATNCAIYNEAAGCPDDDNWGAYEAYINHGAAIGGGPAAVAPEYIGCFADDGNRDLQDGPMQYGYTMDSCADTCSDYMFFALQNNGWCVCSDAYSTAQQYGRRPDGECGGVCAGASEGRCGGGWRNAVYRTRGESRDCGSNGAGCFIGCYNDDGSRDFGSMLSGNGGPHNSFGRCRDQCVQRGNQFMALQYGGECFCNDDFQNRPQYTRRSDSDCNMGCDAHQCGGGWRQSIYDVR